ncbi:hypothetical protein pb186bvf_016083 [Paramecium bursaria]
MKFYIQKLPEYSKKNINIKINNKNRAYHRYFMTFNDQISSILKRFSISYVVYSLRMLFHFCNLQFFFVN